MKFSLRGSGKNEVAKLGTKQRPAIVRVQTTEEAEELVKVAEEHGWEIIVGVEPDKDEDVSDLEKLMRSGARPPVIKPRLPPKISGNDYCPCASGKKFKKCCGAPAATGA